MDGKWREESSRRKTPSGDRQALGHDSPHWRGLLLDPTSRSE